MSNVTILIIFKYWVPEHHAVASVTFWSWTLPLAFLESRPRGGPFPSAPGLQVVPIGAPPITFSGRNRPHVTLQTHLPAPVGPEVELLPAAVLFPVSQGTTSPPPQAAVAQAPHGFCFLMTADSTRMHLCPADQ